MFFAEVNEHFIFLELLATKFTDQPPLLAGLLLLAVLLAEFYQQQLLLGQFLLILFFLVLVLLEVVEVHLEGLQCLF